MIIIHLFAVNNVFSPANQVLADSLKATKRGIAGYIVPHLVKSSALTYLCKVITFRHISGVKSLRYDAVSYHCIMTGVLIKLKSMYTRLPEAERAVADYVLANSKTVPFQSVTELARASNVSVASASRLSKRLGFAGFKDFRIAIAKESAENGITTIYQGISHGDSENDIIDKVFLGNIKSLEDTLKIVSKKDLCRVARRMCKAPRVVFYGIGSSGHIAADASLRFALLDINSESSSDPHEVLVQALRMKKTEVAVGISHSGRSELTCEVLECARSQGALTVGISNYLHCPLHEFSDVFLCTAFAESRVKVAALSSRIAQMCMIDTLYLLTAYFKKRLRKADRINDYVERYLRN